MNVEQCTGLGPTNHSIIGLLIINTLIQASEERPADAFEYWPEHSAKMLISRRESVVLFLLPSLHRSHSRSFLNLMHVRWAFSPRWLEKFYLYLSIPVWAFDCEAFEQCYQLNDDCCCRHSSTLRF